MDDKELVGRKAAESVEAGMLIGLGTGSTANYFIKEIGRRVREDGLSLKGVPSSFSSAILAREEGIPLLSMDEVSKIDLYVDGADEVAPDKSLLKGRGAAMVREKLLAHSAHRFLIIVDSGKLVEKLGSFFPIPVEVLPFAWLTVQKAILSLGGKSALRPTTGKDGPLVTDQGNFVLDALFPKNVDWIPLDVALDILPGVVGHGLFLRYRSKTTVMVSESGNVRVIP